MDTRSGQNILHMSHTKPNNGPMTCTRIDDMTDSRRGYPPLNQQELEVYSYSYTVFTRK